MPLGVDIHRGIAQIQSPISLLEVISSAPAIADTPTALSGHPVCEDVFDGVFVAALTAACLGVLPTLWVVRMSNKASQSASKKASNEDELLDVNSLIPAAEKSTVDQMAIENGEKEKGIHPNHKMAPGVAFVLYVSEILLNMNFTVVLPTSYEVAKRTSAGASASGLIIGAHGIGFLLALPLFVALSRTSCRNGYLLFSFFMIVGNLLYVCCISSPETYGILSILGVRTLTGLECGGTLLGWIVAYRANGPGRYPEITSVRIASGAIGLMSGPLLSSLCHSAFGAGAGSTTDTFGARTADTLPFYLFAIVGVFFGISVWLWFPENAEIPGLVTANTRSQVAGDGGYDEVVLDRSWLALSLDASMTMLRVIQRVGWEAGALFIVAEEFGLGNTVAGYLVPLCLSGLLVAQPIFVALNQRMESEQLADTLHTAEIIGLSFMLRLGGPPTMASLAAFSVGSCIYYGANMSGAALYSPFRGRNALPKHSLLNLETSSVIQMLSVSAGYFTGPVFYRWILSRCLHQNVLVGGAVVLFSCQVVISRASLHVLTAKHTS